MHVLAHEPAGFEGCLVHVEVDIRRGIPQIDLVGLAEGAVREARERVRAAVRNAGFEFPLDRVLVSLVPADLPKEGAAYDLPIALAVLGAAGSLPDPGRPFLALGELGLDGAVRSARGVLPAVAAGLAAGLEDFIVPESNILEARSLGRGKVFGIASLAEIAPLLLALREGRHPPSCALVQATRAQDEDSVAGDLREVRGLARARRALEIAAAGGHHLLLFGPPGSGKTMLARRLPSILPDLCETDAIAVASLRSIAGLLAPGEAPSPRPPFRAPHHSATLEGLIGGGRLLKPGEASLAHRGVLFIDEAPEFRRDALQALREPLEEGRVSIARAGRAIRLPADFQLVVAANPCPCGNLGRDGRVCSCSLPDIQRYWRKLGGPLLDRIDLRVPLRPAESRELLGPPEEPSLSVRSRVVNARRLQAARYAGRDFALNGRIPAGLVERFCVLDRKAATVLQLAAEKLSLSSRASHAVLKVARTIADLAGEASIGEEALLEAVQHRRYGDGDYFWRES